MVQVSILLMNDIVKIYICIIVRANIVLIYE